MLQSRRRGCRPGAVRSLKDSFSEVERENEQLRAKIAAGATIIDIEPTLIDPSPVSDRFRDDDTASYEALKQSIAQRGQEVPVLVREHPTTPGALPKRIRPSSDPSRARTRRPGASDPQIALR